MSSITIDVIRADSSTVDAQLLLGLRGEKGDKGDAFTYADFTPEQLAGLVGATPDIQIGDVIELEEGDPAYATITGSIEEPILNLGLPKGATGKGISSVVLEDDYTLTITYTDGTTDSTGSIRGETGAAGNDGFSPTVDVEAITGGHTVTITDIDGEHEFNVMDGIDGVTDATYAGKSVVSNHVAAIPRVNFYVECATTSSANPKEVIAGGFKYVKGVILAIKFSQGCNSLVNIQVGTTYKYVKYKNTIASTSDPVVIEELKLAPAIGLFMYDGTYWTYIGCVYNTATTSVRGLMSASDKTKLNGIKAGAEVNVQSDWDETDSTSDAFIQNKPTIPTVNDATLTIQQNGEDVATFTANSASNVTADIEVPTKVSDLENDVPFVDINQLYSILPTDTENGNPLTIPDGADEIPMKSVTVEVEPIQDLHGYDKPWAGGAGKNKFDLSKVAPLNSNVIITKTETGFTVTNNNSYPVNVFFNGTNELVFAVTDGAYAISIDSAISIAIEVYGSTDGSSFSWLANGITAGNTSATFNVSGQKYIKFVAYLGANVSVTINKFQFESGNAPTSWTPYSNICPIYGRTGVEVEQIGFNWWDEEWEVGGIVNGQNVTNNGKIRSKNYIPIVSRSPYYFVVGSSGGLNVSQYDKDKTYLSNAFIEVSGSKAVTLNSECRYIRFTTFGSNTTTYNHDISINYPSTDHDYHAYDGDTYSVTWQTEAGTVYGGTVDLVSGVLTVDKVMIDLGTLTYTNIGLSGKNIYAASVNGKKAGWNCLITDRFVNAQVGYDSMADLTITARWSSPTDHIYIRDDSITTASAMKSSLNGTPLVYELATPQTYQLTPQQILSLLGVNNMWTDGDDLVIEYRADIGLFVEKKLS